MELALVFTSKPYTIFFYVMNKDTCMSVHNNLLAVSSIRSCFNSKERLSVFSDKRVTTKSVLLARLNEPRIAGS